MKKIRRGNDFVFAWEIERNGLPEDLSSVLEKHLYLSVLGKRVELVEGVDYDITGNVVRIEVTPTIANILGTYKAEFHYILPDIGLIDEDRKCAVDVDAFVIVNSTAQADDPSEFTVTSDMAIAFKGDKGDSSYQTWLDAGNTGTEADYLAWIQKPATDIEQIVSVNETARVSSEGTRQTNETARISAESTRKTNEINRINAEGLRVTDETSRVNAEALRAEAETARNTAEGERQTNTTTAILQANAARDLANEKAGLAATATTEANTARDEANLAATAANTKAGEANTAATAANTAAGLADTARTELTTAVNTKLGEADDKIEEMNTTLSTYDGRVTQVESDISQLADEVSLLDAVQGAKIKEIENVLSSANLGQSTQVSVSGVSPLSLPKNAANSGMSVKLEGLTEDVGGVITNFEPTGRVRSVDKNGLNPTALYLTAPELRSNGLVKDEIRKGANGYELVKRVGSSLYGSEIMSNSGASGITDWVDSNADGLADGWFKLTSAIGICSIVTGNGFTGNAQRYEADATTTYQGIYFPLAFIGSAAIGKTFKLKFKYRSSSALANSRGEGMVISAPTNTGNAVWYETIWRPTAAMDVGLLPHFRLIIRSSNWAEIDEVSLREIPSADGLIAPTSTFTELSNGTVLYTLATPIISPISYGGILNSAENGTVYHEPIIADAGVYGTNMPILLTDYPIASIEEIIKHVEGVDTYLDVSTAVIAGDKLSFTHPSLANGDLVLFTYAFSKETTNGNITATFYDSNVVKIDTVTGKAYKITDVVTNGVLTRTLTEV